VLRHGERALVEVARVADEATRLRDLLRPRGGAPRRFEATSGGTRVWGLLVAVGGAARPALQLLVNRRPVRDRLLVGAVLRGLREAPGGGGGLRVVVFVELEAGEVDVNVHPAKAEVRFARGGEVFALVERAVRDGVRAGQGRVEVRHFVAVEGTPAAGVASPGPSAYGPNAEPSPTRLFPHPVYDVTPAAGEVSWPAPSHLGGGRPTGGPPDTPLGRLIGQYRSSFLLLEDELGLVVVDQHVAHERVIYERLRRRLEGERAPGQGLLEPLLIEVGDALAAALPRVVGQLSRVGLEVEAFGPGTVRVTALPPELSADSARELVDELLERATGPDLVPEGVVDALDHEVAAALSCRAAIKVNHPLAVEEQQALVRDLAATENPYRCPHGRPIVLRLSQEEMERRLGRR
jgi:DNA mismatch repair protein MutL